MAGIELLIARPYICAKSGNICTRRLEIIKGLKIGIVSEVIVKAEILPRVDVMVEAQGELILRISANGHSLIGAVGAVRAGNETKQIDGDRIHTLSRDVGVAIGIGREDVAPTRSCRWSQSTLGGDRRGTTRSAIQRVCCELIRDAPP